MQVNQSVNSYAVSLFQGAAKAHQSAFPARPASYFTPATQTDMIGTYSDPRMAQAAPVALSESTQRILDNIRSLIGNELKTINTTYRQMAEEDIGRPLPQSVKHSDFTIGERMSLSKETRSAENFKTSFAVRSEFATLDPSNLKGSSFLIGEKFLEMTDAELAEYAINNLVEGQVKSTQRAIEMSQSDEFAKLSDGTKKPTGPVAKMTDEEVETMRSDLLAKWTDAYNRGEIELNLQVFASVHAFNYDKIYKTLDLGTGDTSVNAQNAVTFDKAWEFSEARKASMERSLTGIGGSQFLDRLGDYAEEYLKDATS
ncbi:hypothetical protein [Roseobacter weihaiensis]|uniref:hypothetical protein n=1 Tax=Roseobacter weihaiensis TaxID=2763262 RepID=UPI001D0A2149|nr:hypothetical protein [Roseobacter sp. H9]